MSKPVRILYLEDRPEDVELLTEGLAREYLACEITWVNGRDSYLSALRDGWNYDLLLVDYCLPDIGGEEALELARERAPNLPIIILSGRVGEECAVACLRRGATDFVLKTNLPRVAPVLRRALEEARVLAARREAEAAQARVGALLRAALESTSEGILVVDLAGRVSAYNRKFLSLCGIPDFVMAPMEIGEVIQYLTGQFGDPSALLDEARLLTARSDKESTGLLAINGQRVLEQTGRPHRVGTETVGRVLSFREARPRETPSDLLKTLGNGRQGFGEATLAARVAPWFLVEDRLVMPEAAEAILGVKPLPADLGTLVDLFHPEDAELLKEALEQGRNVAFKARMRGPGGAWRWVQWHVDRGPDGHRGVLMDIGEQERHLDRALARKRVEGARDTARRLAGRLHDHVRACVTDLEAGLQPEALGSLRDLDGFLAQLRVFAHLGRPAKVAVQPNLFVAACVARAQLEAGPLLRIQFEPGEDLPEVHLDAAQVELALGALLQNAGQALGGAGDLRVATRLQAPRAHRSGGRPGYPRTRVVLEVRDQGPGIPPGIQKQMFEPFFTTRLERGRLGLGLSIVREVAEAHQGSVQVESTPEAGTAVRILLPV